MIYAPSRSYSESYSSAPLVSTRLFLGGLESSATRHVLAGNAARAFDWNKLTRERVINDRVGSQPVLLLLGADGASFHAFDARPGGSGPQLELERTADPSRFRDRATGATWDESGLALDGPQAGRRLTALPAYQELWHSWQTFQPATTARGNAAS